jgi:hypothetical protein
LAMGPSSITTEIPISWIPPHLLQETKTSYPADELFAAADVTRFSCIEELPFSLRKSI